MVLLYNIYHERTRTFSVVVCPLQSVEASMHAQILHAPYSYKAIIIPNKAKIIPCCAF